ncbi:MAG: hypothetical protein PHT94_03105 [Candidatus Nanoarchaeia archaeon]|nr:hypothetical protein [Candidatus Nanoarchaeia archaeon]
MAKITRRVSSFSGKMSNLQEGFKHVLQNKFLLYRHVRVKNRKVRIHIKKLHSNENKIRKALKNNDYGKINSFLKSEQSEIRDTLDGIISIFSDEDELLKRELNDILKLLNDLEEKDKSLTEEDFKIINMILNNINNSIIKANNLADSIKQRAIDTRKNLGIVANKLNNAKSKQLNEINNLEKELKKIS